MLHSLRAVAADYPASHRYPANRRLTPSIRVNARFEIPSTDFRRTIYESPSIHGTTAPPRRVVTSKGAHAPRVRIYPRKHRPTDATAAAFQVPTCYATAADAPTYPREAADIRVPTYLRNAGGLIKHLPTNATAAALLRSIDYRDNGYDRFLYAYDPPRISPRSSDPRTSKGGCIPKYSIRTRWWGFSLRDMSTRPSPQPYFSFIYQSQNVHSANTSYIPMCPYILQNKSKL